jgi:16S rRNA (guanine527-N7)-methyltransferase
MISSITHYFPDITDVQQEQMEHLHELYVQWNEKINVISRRDIGNLYLHHVLHSLAIVKVIKFMPGTRVLDAGTGGGFPGIPLAIMFPEASFHLVDSIGKKIKVVHAVAEALHLTNVTAIQSRAENVAGMFDFIISRAVTGLPEFCAWTMKNVSNMSRHNIANGILYLKGGDLSGELKELKAHYHLYPIPGMFTEDYFSEKFVVHIYP